MSDLNFAGMSGACVIRITLCVYSMALHEAPRTILFVFHNNSTVPIYILYKTIIIIFI